MILLIGCFPSRAGSAALSILFFREKQSIEARRVVALQLLHILPGGFLVHPVPDDLKDTLKVAGADNVHQFFRGGQFLDIRPAHCLQKFIGIFHLHLSQFVHEVLKPGAIGASSRRRNSSKWAYI